MTSATPDSAAEILSKLNINAGDWPPNLVKNLHLLSPDQVFNVPNPVLVIKQKLNLIYNIYIHTHTRMGIRICELCALFCCFGRLNWRRYYWRWDRAICFSIGQSLASRTTKRKPFSLRFFFFFKL